VKKKERSEQWRKEKEKVKKKWMKYKKIK